MRQSYIRVAERPNVPVVQPEGCYQLDRCIHCYERPKQFFVLLGAQHTHIHITSYLRFQIKLWFYSQVIKPDILYWLLTLRGARQLRRAKTWHSPPLWFLLFSLSFFFLHVFLLPKCCAVKRRSLRGFCRHKWIHVMMMLQQNLARANP